jgi:Zn-finger nucleic acid-binding protein
MKFLRLCPKCRGKVQPNDGSTVGVWWCPRCEWAYTDAQIRECIDNRPGGKLTSLK